ncbi:MAG TPA: hypothetical protein VIL86_08905 [Tepidisphaeraceae bacterium]|jgi:hypothetical protein
MSGRALTILAAAVLVALAGLDGWGESQALGQEEPIVIGERQQIEKLHLDPPSVALDLVGRYNSDRTNSGGTTNSSRETDIEETLTLQTHGHVLAPRFLDLSLSGTFGSNQTWFDADNVSDQQIGLIYNWDARGTFFRESDSPLTLYSQRTRELINQQFGPTIESTTTTEGAVLDWHSKSLRNRFEISHTDTTQSGLVGGETFNLSRNLFSWSGSADLTPRQTLSWDYSYTNAQQSGTIDSSFDAHAASLTHALTFGNKDHNSLTSSLSYSTTSGRFETENFRYDELLRIRHSDTFQTRYEYTYEQFRFGDTDQGTHRALAGFTHHLYESLTTNGEAGAQFQQISGGGDTSEYFASLNFDYRKKAPFGVFLGTLGLGYTRTESDPRNSSTQILNQPATLGDIQPIIIPGRGLNPSSVIVTDAAGIVQFVPGIDYTVTTFADRMEIARVVGGAIAPGQSVLLSYVLPPTPGSTADTTLFSIGGRYNIDRGPLKGLGVYVAYTRTDQTIDTNDPAAFVPNSSQDTVIGTDYRFWKNAALIGAEHEWFNANIAPFEASRFFLRVSQRTSPATVWNGELAYHIIDYQEAPAHTSDIFTASISVRQRITQRLSGLAAVTYRYEVDDLTGTSQGFEQFLQINWQYRQTSVYAMVRNSSLSTDTEDRNFQTFEIGLHREF